MHSDYPHIEDHQKKNILSTEILIRPAEFRRAMNNVFAGCRRVSEPKQTIFYTFFKYDEHKP